LDTFYRSDTREDGSDIRQTLKLHLVPVGLSLRYVAGNRSSVAPYLTVGADAIWYEYEEFGDFIDFFDPTRPIVPDSFRSDGWAFGGHAALGVRIPVGHDFAITAEGRYQFAEKKQMDDDFYRSRLDLNGPSATLGVRLRF